MANTKSSMDHVEEVRQAQPDVQKTELDDREARLLNKNQKTTRYMVVFAVWLAFTAWIWNFDASYGGVVLIMPTFNRDFGTCQMVPIDHAGHVEEVCLLSATQQSLVSLTYLFGALGGGISSLTGTYLGRRGTLMLGSLVTAIGAAGMLGTAGSYTAYMACKCIGAVGIGHLYAGGTVYGVESMPPRKRGFLLALYSIGLASGSLTATAVCYGSSMLATSWQWKTPIIIQIPLALILIGGLCFFPESPRWLLLRGQEERARRSLGRFLDKDPYSLEVTAQIRETQHYIEIERGTHDTTSWTEIFGKKDIRRTLCSVLVLVGLAITGGPFTATYGALFLKTVGAGNPYVINLILGGCSLAGTPFGPFMVEYGGRRFSILVGYAGMGICMLIFSAVSTGLGAKSKITIDVLIASLCFWAFVFAVCVASSLWTASAEMHSLRNRTHGQAFTILVSQIVTFAAAFWTPYQLSAQYGNMGTNVGYFYFGLTVIILVLTFIFVPETASLSLEQIDDFFSSGQKAWKTSTKKNKETQE